jgi:hypothetical protein
MIKIIVKMKKNIFYGLAILGIAIIAVVNVNLGSKSSNLSEVALKNLEALTQEGTTPGYVTCYSTFSHEKMSDNERLWEIIDCYNCSPVNCYAYQDKGVCQKSNSGGGIFV